MAIADWLQDTWFVENADFGQAAIGAAALGASQGTITFMQNAGAPVSLRLDSHSLGMDWSLHLIRTNAALAVTQSLGTDFDIILQTLDNLEDGPVPTEFFPHWAVGLCVPFVPIRDVRAFSGPCLGVTVEAASVSVGGSFFGLFYGLPHDSAPISTVTATGNNCRHPLAPSVDDGMRTDLPGGLLLAKGFALFSQNSLARSGSLDATFAGFAGTLSVA